MEASAPWCGDPPTYSFCWPGHQTNHSSRILRSEVTLKILAPATKHFQMIFQTAGNHTHNFCVLIRPMMMCATPIAINSPTHSSCALAKDPRCLQQSTPLHQFLFTIRSHPPTQHAQISTTELSVPHLPCPSLCDALRVPIHLQATHAANKKSLACFIFNHHPDIIPTPSRLRNHSNPSNDPEFTRILAVPRPSLRTSSATPLSVFPSESRRPTYRFPLPEILILAKNAE